MKYISKNRKLGEKLRHARMNKPSWSCLNRKVNFEREEKKDASSTQNLALLASSILSDWNDLTDEEKQVIQELINVWRTCIHLKDTRKFKESVNEEKASYTDSSRLIEEINQLFELARQKPNKLKPRLLIKSFHPFIQAIEGLEYERNGSLRDSIAHISKGCLCLIYYIHEIFKLSAPLPPIYLIESDRVFTPIETVNKYRLVCLIEINQIDMSDAGLILTHLSKIVEIGMEIRDELMMYRTMTQDNTSARLVKELALCVQSLRVMFTSRFEC